MIDPKTTEAVELLKSRDLKKRVQALELVSQLEGRESLALLLKALHDQSWTLRDNAIPRLKARGSGAVLPILHHLQSGVWFTRTALAQVLEAAGDERALLPLFRLLSDSNKSVTEAAQKALQAVILRSDPWKLGHQISQADAVQRGAFLAYLKKLHPALTESVDQHLKPAPDDPITPGQDLAERLQQLRKAFKASLRQAEQDYEES
jgi:HEAT repeat protein